MVSPLTHVASHRAGWYLLQGGLCGFYTTRVKEKNNRDEPTEQPLEFVGNCLFPIHRTKGSEVLLERFPVLYRLVGSQFISFKGVATIF